MKIISLQKNIRSAVQAVAHIAQKNSSLPILNNILISAKDGVIKLISTNLEIGITSILRGKIEVDGDFTVDSRMLSEYVSLLDNDKITIEVADEEMIISSEKQKSKIKGTGADEFPLIPNINKEEWIELSPSVFKKALSRVVFAVSSDESRVELSGILFSITDKKVTLAGTDSYRLAESSIEATTNLKEERQIIVPARTVQELIRIITNETDSEEGLEKVVLYISENQCLFLVGSVELVSRLIDGQYPDYKQIIPTKHDCRVAVDREEFARSVKAAAIFSRTGINDVIFSFNNSGEIEISAASGQSGEHVSHLAATVTGNNVSITLNHRFIIDGLAVFSGHTILLEVVDDQTPCLIRAEDDQGYMYVIMPIKK